MKKMAKKKIEVNEEDFRYSLSTDLMSLVGCEHEAEVRTQEANIKTPDANFYLNDTDTLDKKFLKQYTNSVTAEMIGAIVASAIRRQIELDPEKKLSAIAAAELLLHGSTMGQALELSEEDIKSLLAPKLMHDAMIETKKKVFRTQTRKESMVKITFMGAHFSYVSADTWNRFSPYMRAATFLTRDNLIRLIMYRETGTVIKDLKDLEAFDEKSRKEFSPNRNTTFRKGIEKLCDEVSLRDDPKSGAQHLLKECMKANKSAGRDFIKLEPSKVQNFMKKLSV